MKKKTIKINGKEMTIQVFETEYEFDSDTTVEEFHKKLDVERRLDDDMDHVAGEIASKLPGVNLGTRTIVYWEIGGLIEQYMGESLKKSKSQKEPYEVIEPMLERLLEKVSDHLEKSHATVRKDDYSVPYFLKLRRLRRTFTRKQAERPVPYSLAHELLYSELSPADIDMFLDKCESGEIRTNYELRKAVADYRKAKGLREDEPDAVDMKQ